MAKRLDYNDAAPLSAHEQFEQFMRRQELAGRVQRLEGEALVALHERHQWMRGVRGLPPKPRSMGNYVLTPQEVERMKAAAAHSCRSCCPERATSILGH